MRPSRPRPHSQIIECLATIRERAAHELNTVFTTLRRRVAVQSSPYSPLRFLVSVSSVSTVLRDADLAHTIISLLIQNGIIASRRASPEMVEALNALADAGILQYDATRRGYDVTALYQEPLAAFRNADVRHLTTTVRARRQRRASQ